MKIALVCPDISACFSGIECTYRNLPPATALPLLACETERRLSQQTGLRAEIVAFNRPEVTDEFIESVAASDLVGFTTWFSNHENAIGIARRVKRLSPETQLVFGGPNAANLGDRILQRRPFTDFVVSGDGEDVLWRIACRQDPSTIPNLWYRSDTGEIRFTYSNSADLEEIQPFDFRHVADLDLSAYDSRLPGYSYDPLRLPITVSWMRGCPRAASSKRCAYCSIPEAELRFLSPDRAWQQISHIREHHGITAFFEGGDDLTAGDYAERLLASPVRIPGVTFRSYCGLWRLTESKVKTLRELGMTEIFIGLETIDSEVNQWSGHRVTPKLVHRALALLKTNGISICIPFLLGLPGESLASLESSEALAVELVERYDNIRMVLVSLGIPLLGSDWFRQLMNDEVVRREYSAGNLVETDNPDYAHLLELSVRRYCSATLDDIVETVHRLRSRFAEKSAVGCYGGLDLTFASSVTKGETLQAKA